MRKTIKSYLNRTDLDKLQTPVFVYFPQQTKENIRKFKKFEKNGIEVFYAIKANTYPDLVKQMVDAGFGFDVASKEEFTYLVDMGADPSKLSFSAPTKRSDDLTLAGKLGIPYYAFDSEEEVRKITRLIKDPTLFGRISTPSKESVFDLSSKFGMNDKYYETILRKGKKEGWNIRGLTFHVGSQNVAITSWRDSMKKIEHLIDLSKSYGYDIDFLNLGGGIPAKYNGHSKDVEYYINGIIRLAKQLNHKYHFKKIIVEPGRAISADTTALVTEVINIKPYKKPPLIIVDSSIFGGLIEALEHFEYPIFTVDDLTNSGLQRKGKKYFRIGGYSCDGYDIINHKVLLPKEMAVGDKLVILYAGAYTSSCENFHMKPFPKIITAE